MYVTDIAGAGVHVLERDGSVIGFYAIDGNPTNCTFDGQALLVTDAGRLADGPDPSLHGRLWRLHVGSEGQEVRLGRIGLGART
jgi:sugar lactone lactonase YvrE